MSQEFRDAMKSKFPLWSAVLAGMASPASLYAEPQNYDAYAKPNHVVHGFALAGAYLTNSVARLNDVGKRGTVSRPRKRAQRA